MNNEDENLNQNQEELNQSQSEPGMQEQLQYFQDVTSNALKQHRQKSKTKRFMGERIKDMGNGIHWAGEKLESAGNWLKQRGNNLYKKSKQTFDRGKQLSKNPYTMAAGIPMMIAGALGMTIGKILEFTGLILKVIGKVLQFIGNTLIKLGNRIIQQASKELGEAAGSSGGGLGKSSNDSDSKSGTGGIPGIFGGGGQGKFKKVILIAVIAIIAFIIVLIGIKESEIDDGKYVEGDNSNVPYVISSQVMDKLVIVNDSTGNYTYAFQNDEGEIISVDEAIDHALEVLIQNESTALDYLGETEKSQKELLKKMIQAEISTQYPDLTLNEDLGLETSTTRNNTSSSEAVNDYCVKTDEPDSMPVLNETQLLEIVEKSPANEEAKATIREVIPSIVKAQEKYKVNAVFCLAVTFQESGWGTGWDYIDKSTYNWTSVKGKRNGGYLGKDGEWWNVYTSWEDCTNSWFELIAQNQRGNYFANGDYTCNSIGHVYCTKPPNWGGAVSRHIETFYGYLGITPNVVGVDGGYSVQTNQQNTGAIKIDKEIKAEDTVQGGIKIQRKDEDGNLIDLKYTSTKNFNALVSQNSEEALNYYTLVKTSATGNSNNTISGGSATLSWQTTISFENWNAYQYYLGAEGVEYTDPYVEGYITQDRKSYIITTTGGYRYAGPGVQLESNVNFFEEEGIDINSLSVGSQIDCEIVHRVSQKALETSADIVRKDAADKGFTLTEQQIQAVADIYYMWGAYSDVSKAFWSAYSQYGNSDELANNYSGFYNVPQNATSDDLANLTHGEARRASRWLLFNYGRYVSNVGEFTESSDSTSSSSNSSSSTTSIGTGSFADIAKECHAYLRENGYTYPANGAGRSLPVEAGDCGYIDCTAYVSMVLDNFGIKDWAGYPNQLSSTSLVEYGKSSLETVHSGKVTNISEISDKLQPGDIIVQTAYGDASSSAPGHAQIFYGFNENNQAVWLNCGGNDSINRVEGQDAYNDFSRQPILYVFRVQGGNSGSVVQSLDNFLFIGDSRYEGIESQLQALGNNITAKGVGSSIPKNWIQPIKDGGGIVYKGQTTSDSRDIGTLPTTVSGVSVMLGVNNVNGSSQISDMQELLNTIHDKYPNVPVFVNSVYRLGTAYGSATDSMNQSVDTFNEAMKNFCNQNSWAYYVDISGNLYDGSGYLKGEYSGDGLHISSTEGINTLVGNIENGILSSGAATSNSTSSKSDRPGFSLVVANRKDVNTVVVNSYTYSNTYYADIGHNSYFDKSKRFTDGIASETNSRTVTTYSSSTVDYQTALQNFTLYFDFLWAILVDSGNTQLVTKWANLVTDADNVTITVYNDTNISTSSSSQDKGIITRTNFDDDGVYVSDTYSCTETTTVTTTTLTSKPCVTYADTWLMKYENDASSYNEFKSKDQEIITEKTDVNSKEKNIIKILRSNDSTLQTLTSGQYKVEEMIEDNEKVSFMIDIYDYILKIANGKNTDNLDFSLNELLNTNLFDLTTTEDTVSTKVLLYDSISISESDKELLYRAIEKICESYGTSDENYQRKKYITSVILNRVLSSEFPNSIKEILNEEYQFENFDPSMFGNQITVSEETKDAVDYVLIGGDCSQYSVYFAKPSTATSNNWDTLYKFTVNDGDGSDNSFNYYTTESIIAELQRYETTITGSVTKPSGTAEDIVNWAKKQVGKSEYNNKYSNTTSQSKETAAQFVKSAYYEAGLEYLSADAKDLPHPNEMKYRNNGTVDWSDIPTGAIIVSEGTANNGHVALYVGNGYVIEAGGDKIQKVPIDQSYGSGTFLGWGFAMSDQDKAHEKLVVTIGSNYAQGWTPNSDDERYNTGISGVFKAGDKQYNVYVQGYNGVWAKKPYSEQDYANSACGATSTAIVLTGLGIDVTPYDVGSTIQGYGIDPTSHDALSRVLDSYNIKNEWKSRASKEEVIEHLKQGNPVIVHVYSGDPKCQVGARAFNCHYVTLLGIDANGRIFVGDPAGAGKYNGYFEQSQFNFSGISYICFVSK